MFGAQALYRDLDLAWPTLACELGCGPSQLTGLRTARFAVRMTLAMAITQWMERPAADLVCPARWWLPTTVTG